MNTVVVFKENEVNFANVGISNVFLTPGDGRVYMKVARLIDESGRKGNAIDLSTTDLVEFGLFEKVLCLPAVCIRRGYDDEK